MELPKWRVLRWPDKLPRYKRSVLVLSLVLTLFILLNLVSVETSLRYAAGVSSVLLLLLGCTYSEYIFLQIKKYRKARKKWQKAS